MGIDPKRLGPRARAQLARRELPATGTKPSKYRNVKVVVDGERFDSRAEAKRWGQLKLLKLAGEITDLRRQVPYPILFNGQLICEWRADFVYKTRDGTTVAEDVKGFRTELYRLKKKMVQAQYRIEIKEIQA